MNKRTAALLCILTLAVLALAGCTKQVSMIKDAQSDITGLNRSIAVYDFWGQKTESYVGNNVRLDKSEVENAILITMDGRSITMVGNTAVIAEEGVQNLMDDPQFAKEFESIQKDLAQPAGAGSGLTFLDKRWNNLISGVTGLKRILIVKAESGRIIGVFRGNNVLLEASELPNTTKILIDGKRLHLHRTAFSIVELK